VDMEKAVQWDVTRSKLTDFIGIVYTYTPMQATVISETSMHIYHTIRRYVSDGSSSNV